MAGNEQDLLRAVLGDTPEPGIVCMVGAGGKKTAIKRLAAAFTERWPGARVAADADLRRWLEDLPIKARLPEEKRATLALIDRALKGKIDLKPEYMRGL